MALCGVKFEIISLCLQSEQSCFQRLWVTNKSKNRWIGDLSFNSQNELSDVVTFLKGSNNLLRYKTLLIILY